MCDFCRKFDFGFAKIHIDKYGASLVRPTCDRFPIEEQFNFCPNCGTPMKEILEVRRVECENQK